MHDTTAGFITPTPLPPPVSLRVLVPLDGSQRSFDALRGALKVLAGKPGVRVTLFNVVNEGLEEAEDPRVEEFDLDEEDEVFPNEAASSRMLAKATSICKAERAESVERTVKGNVYESILAACREHDLLVMHVLDESQLKEKLRGSQTETLARKAKIPVLLVEQKG